MNHNNIRHWSNFTLKSGGDQWRRQDLVSGGHDDRGAIRHRVGWGMVRGVRSPANYGVWGSVMISPSGVRGGALVAIAFSAYFRPQKLRIA